MSINEKLHIKIAQLMIDVKFLIDFFLFPFCNNFTIVWKAMKI